MKNVPLCSWFNLSIAKAIAAKDRIARKYRANKRNISLKLKYHALTKKVKSVINAEKQKFIERSLNQNDPKKMWRNLNELLGRKPKHKLNSIFNNKQELIVDEKEIAELLNSHFVGSVSSLKDNLKPSLFNIDTPSENKSIVLDDTCEEEVRMTINSLKNSSPGIDGISVEMIKSMKDDLSPLLSHLINRMFATSVYPAYSKTALVIPLNKTGDKTNINDYRPISMLSILNKIVEKIFLKRLQDFTHEYLNLIYCRQYGFRPKCNTEIATTELVQVIQEAIDQKFKVSMVSMDLQKAFDVVDVQKLIKALSNAGIRGNALNLIHSYLIHRNQIVKVGDKLSSPIKFSQGVVQGSILGPWLFTVFINSIANLQLCGKLFLYADDCILVNFHEQQEQIESKICNDMKLIINYFCRQSLILNQSKTNFIIFHSSNLKVNDPDEILIESCNQDTLSIAGSYLIKRVDKVKYLGLILDLHLKWD